MRLRSRINYFKWLCTGITAIHFQFVTAHIEMTMSFPCQLKTTLIHYYVSSIGIAMHLTGSKQSFCRNACTGTDDVHILKRFRILSTASISLSAVEDNLTPTAHNRRRKHWITILITELIDENHRDSEAGTQRYIIIDTAETILIQIVHMILYVLAINRTFLNIVGFTILFEGIVARAIIYQVESCFDMRFFRISVGSRDSNIYLFTRFAGELRNKEACIADIHRIALVEIHQRVRRINLAPTNTVFQEHRTDGRLATCIGSLVSNAEQGFTRSLCIDEILRECSRRLQLRHRIGTIQCFVYRFNTLIVFLHIEIYTR